MRVSWPIKWMGSVFARGGDRGAVIERTRMVVSGTILQDHQDEIAEWQVKTFPEQELAGKLAHLVKEAKELQQKPNDIEEWADVLNLLLGSAAMAGLDVYELLMAGRMKFAIVRERKWGPMEPDGTYHHVQEGK